jgi:hypothetical protein
LLILVHVLLLNLVLAFLKLNHPHLRDRSITNSYLPVPEAASLKSRSLNIWYGQGRYQSRAFCHPTCVKSEFQQYTDIAALLMAMTVGAIIYWLPQQIKFSIFVMCCHGSRQMSLINLTMELLIFLTGRHWLMHQIVSE